MSKKIKIIETNSKDITYTGAWENTGNITEVQLESATQLLNNMFFGETGNSLMNPDDEGSLLNGEDFVYDESLDDDSGDGVDIYDNNVSGVFDTGKYFRIVENGYNITDDVDGLGLEVIAKNLGTLGEPTSEKKCYVDPESGKFIMPSPVVWSKCETLDNLEIPEIGINYKPNYSISIAYGSVTAQPFKFGNGIRAYNSQRSSGAHGQITINPFTENPPDASRGVTSYYSWVHGGARGIDDNTYYRGYNRFHLTPSTYIEHAEFGGFPGHIYLRLYINGIKIQEIVGGLDRYNMIVAWNVDGLDSGNTIEVYADGTLKLSTTNSISPSVPYYWLRGECNNGGSRSEKGYAYIDNYKIWLYDIKTVSDVIAMEFNGGAGREDALHSIYGSANQYKPVVEVGYYLNLSSDDPVILNEPTGEENDEVQLESASNYSNGSGSFGDGMGKWVSGIAPPSMVVDSFLNEIDFNYDTELDIYDTGNSGAIDKLSGKHFRIVHDGLNINTSPGSGGLGLVPIAKNLSNNKISPPSNEAWIDPSEGIFCLPRPNYYSKCDSEENLSVGAICSDNTPIIDHLEWGGANWNYIGKSSSNAFSPQTPKFGESLQFFTYSGGKSNIFPFGKNIPVGKGTISFWNYQYPESGYWFLTTSITFGHSSFVKFFNDWNGNINNELFISGVLQGSENVKELQNNWHHIYILFDKDGGLDSGKTVRVFVDNSEIFSSTETFIENDILITLEAQYQSGYNVSQSQIIDNIKVWKDTLESHNVSNPAEWLYNLGDGREDALHTIYGAENDYMPNLLIENSSGVGYFYLENFGKKAEWIIDENTSSALIYFRQETNGGIANIDVKNITKGVNESVNNRISLYNPSFDSGQGRFKEYPYYINFEHPEDKYKVVIRHAGKHNIDSSGPNHPIKIDKFAIKESLTLGSINTTLYMWHDEFPDDIYSIPLEPYKMNTLNYIIEFNGDRVKTEFSIPAHIHVYKLYEVSINGGSTWLPSTDVLFDWGSNPPVYDDEELSINRQLTVKFNLPPAVGTGNVQIKIIPYTNKYKVIRSISQPNDGGVYVDITSEVRLLDDSIELIKEG